MICPVLEPSATSRSCYFPSSRWYDGYHLLSAPGPSLPHRQATATVPLPLDATGVFFRGGSVIPAQLPATTTVVSRGNPFVLYVFLDDDRSAAGQLFYDDGDSVATVEDERYFLANIAMSQDSDPSRLR